MNQREPEEIPQQQPRWRYTTAKKKSSRREDDMSTALKKSPFRDQRIMNKINKVTDKTAELQQLYRDLMEQSEYTRAEEAKATIKYLTNKNKQKRIRMLSSQHSRQKDELKLYHRRELHKFKQAWSQIFVNQAMEEKILMQKLSQMRKNDEEQSRFKIARRCQSAKPTVQLAKLNQLLDSQRYLRKRGKTVELRKVRDQKRKLIEQCKKKQKRMVDKIAEQEQRRIAEKQTRRYRSFMHRIQETRRDNERIYRREEHRLKQKYKNILQKLERQQKQDFNQLQRSRLI